MASINIHAMSIGYHVIQGGWVAWVGSGPPGPPVPTLDRLGPRQ
jgi:hypothetical protein